MPVRKPRGTTPARATVCPSFVELGRSFVALGGLSSTDAAVDPIVRVVPRPAAGLALVAGGRDARGMVHDEILRLRAR